MTDGELPICAAALRQCPARNQEHNENSSILRSVAIALSVTVAQAHFLFVVPAPGNASAKAFISETLTPDPAVNAAIIAGAKLMLRTGGSDSPLTLGEGMRTATPLLSPVRAPRVIHGKADLGLSTMALPRPISCSTIRKRFWVMPIAPTPPLEGKPVEIVPKGKPGANTVAAARQWQAPGGRNYCDFAERRA